ncbi:hypothetical protein CAPTEDRAFT_5824 [Capitella teleta]|uniref:Uncharacterized protein n=1 Tax=Capitella teleta TaxID=283909 RepID=R7UFJ2_CAPTE|nr:hypothetical protein CAPTEDRAFT_5824 [Capitella teleta]|eukprot:ELU04873.1 hypothetical protein CAPTEDRAFT_5824 [Capitella teleta]
MTRGYWLEHDEARYAEKRKRVYTFMKIPREVEKFMTYGFFQCLDAFLYLFTFLPLRFFLASVHLSVRSCLLSCWSSPRRILEPAQICDILKGLVLILCCVLLNYVDVSMMYHLIRGQAIIKLYIFFNMLEVADRLFSSFGQDILDSLFWTATEPRGRKREHFGVIPHLILAVFYVFMHAILVLFQATTLNVAFNSHNKALMTIMMSNNFVELKGSVFKKFEKNNLFQMSCSDVRERFHLIVLLGIVGVRNMTEFSWNMDHLMVLIPDIFLVLLSEFLVDWVKHAFITKFNDISSDVYREYTVSIAYDLANSRQKNAFSDLVDVVSRRMGFIPLPLAALLIRVVVPLIRFKGWVTYAVISVGFLCLLSAKVLCSILLLGKSAVYIQESKDRGAQLDPDRTSAEEELQSRNSDSISQKILFSNSTVSLQSVGLNEDYVKDKSTHNAEMVLSKRHVHGLTPEKNEKPARVQKPLSEIDRYTMCSNRII